MKWLEALIAAIKAFFAAKKKEEPPVKKEEPPVVVVPPATPGHPAGVKWNDLTGYWHSEGCENDLGAYDATPFLWKPISDGDGNAVVVLGFLSRAVSIKAAGDEGRYAGRGNGHRQTFRLPRPGPSYNGPVKVVATGIDGTLTTWIVPDPTQRWSGHGVTK